MAVGLTVPKIGKGKKSEGSAHNEIVYNSLNMQCIIAYTTELECIVNGRPWQRFALSECS